MKVAFEATFFLFHLIVYNLQYKRRETCVAIGLDNGNQEGWSQFVFLEYDDEEKICGIELTNGDHYQFGDAFRSWEEMDEALKEKFGKNFESDCGEGNV